MQVEGDLLPRCPGAGRRGDPGAGRRLTFSGNTEGHAGGEKGECAGTGADGRVCVVAGASGGSLPPYPVFSRSSGGSDLGDLVLGLGREGVRTTTTGR